MPPRFIPRRPGRLGRTVVGSLAATAVLVALALPGVEPGDEHAGHGDHGMRMIPVPAAAQVPTAPVLARAGWTATASDQETVAEQGQASNVLDGNVATSWVSKWAAPATGFPHSITIDMKSTQQVSALRYKPRPRASANGTIGRYEVSLSSDGTTFAAPVTTGTWADDDSGKTAAFATQSARFVRLTALSEAGNRGPWSSAGEINLLEASTTTPPPSGAQLDRTGWRVVASDQETAVEQGQAYNVLDGNPATIWVSKWSGTPAPFPHSITIELPVATGVSGLKYLPRVAPPNGRIGAYTVAVSTNGTSFTQVATGTFADNATEQTATFTETQARFVRLTVTSETGSRGPWSAAAEINLLGTPAPPPTASVLNRTGWQVVAGDEQISNDELGTVGQLLDGDPATSWVSRWSGAAAPFPHAVTVEMLEPASVSGLKYLPRAAANGRIGAYTVSVSTNGTAFTQVATGTFADSATEKTVTFPAATAKFVRLTATSEAGNRGPWSAVAELNLLGTGGAAPPTGNTTGAWSSVIGFPIVPSSMAILPGNKVLLWSAVTATSFGGGNPAQTQVAVLDLTTNEVSQRTIVNTNHEMFCTGIATLPDGRILITGGSSAGRTTIYNPANDSWSAGPDLNIPRGYQTDVTLSTGQVFTLGGSWSGARGGKNGELFTPDGTWKSLPGVTADKIVTKDEDGVWLADNHGWFFAVGNGGVFHAGPSSQMNWIATAGNGTITSAGNRAASPDSMNGNAVMYEPGKIFTTGGAPNYKRYSVATPTAHVIDISAGPGQAPVVRRVGDSLGRRSYGNSVVLPDGQVFVVGGQTMAETFTDTTPVMTPELWNPVTGRFSPMAKQAVIRTYHSVAALLPDGRVFSGGGGLCGGCATNHPDGQIFTPPYLLDADGSAKARPTVTAAPANAAPGSTVQVTTGAAVKSFALIRMVRRRTR